MYLAFWDVVIVCVKIDVYEECVCRVYICWWFNAIESSLSVCSELCPVFISIVSECMSVLL